MPKRIQKSEDKLFATEENLLDSLEDDGDDSDDRDVQHVVQARMGGLGGRRTGYGPNGDGYTSLMD